MLSLFKNNLLLATVIFVGISGFLLPHVSEAKNVSWSTTYNGDLYYYWDGNWASSWTNTACCGRALGLRNPIVTVGYQADIFNNTTNALIADGSSIPVGTVLRFQPKSHAATDISWFGTGFSQDSPNGYWNPGAAYPYSSPTCDAQDFVGVAANSMYRIYAPFAVNIPNKTITHSGTATLSCNADNSVCTVTAPGTINTSIGFASTFGKFYYAYQNSDGTGCTYGGYTYNYVTSTYSGSPVALSQTMALAGPDFQLPINQQTITFTLTATGGNNPPTTPTITGPTTGTPNTAYDFTISGGTDPDGDQVRYGITDAGCSAVPQWLPGSGYFTPGSQTYAGKSWATPGIYKIYVLSEDSKTGRSGCASQTVTIAAASSASCIVSAPEDAPIINECSRSASGGYVMGQDFNSAYVINLDGGNNYYLTCEDNRLIADSICNTGQFLWQGQSACQGPFPECAPASLPSADLKINNSDTPITVTKGTNLNLVWNSTNAASCTLYGAGAPNGTVSTTGNINITALASDTYILTCGTASPDSIVVTVQNQPPNPPTITGPSKSGTRTTNQPVTFTILGTDPDNDNIFYEVDWNNDGTVDATTMTVPSNTAQSASYTWTTSGNQTFQARTVDLQGARSTWTSHTENIVATPPTATLQVSINGGPYTNTTPITVDPGDTVSMQWSSTDTTGCSATAGSGFAASGPSGTDPVNTPTPNTTDTFSATCSGAGGNASASIVVTTKQKPNFNQPNVTIGNLGAFNTTTGTYASVDVTFGTQNDGGSVTKAAAPYLVEMTNKAPMSGTIPSGLNPGSQGFTKTVTIPGPITFGTSTVKVSIDTPIATNGSVLEVTEGDADNTRTATLPVPPPDPGLSITADRTRVRNTETTTIRWNTAMSYAGLSCTVTGPSLNLTAAPATGSRTTQPITAKSEYTFTCTETTTGKVFKKMTTVETEGKIEEV